MAEPSPALVKRAQAGDPEALSALVQSQQTYVYSIAMSLMHNPADAADMTQEAFVRLLRSLGTYRAETKFTTWLYRLADNDRWTQPEQEIALRESATEVRAALDELPAAQRLALTLHYFEDMRYEDIAETMHLPLNTVKSHIRRGKE